MQWLFLTLVTLYVVTLSTYARRNYYLKCTEETHLNPGVCDCTKYWWTRCFLNLTITKNRYDDPSKIDESKVFSVNGGRIGPTIIARYNQLVVVDVYNKISDPESPDDANISIHWHGMHQWNTAFMDGVAMITQWPTKPQDAFRHVFWAKPAGTHWYHSHVLYQRDKGIVGAFIVRDRKSKNTDDLLKDVNDEPAERMLAIRDHEKETNSRAARFSVCEPDGSEGPLDPALVGFKSKLEAFRINGVPLADRFIDPNANLTFYVKRGMKYRFRIVGIMSSYVIRFSIFKHKLHVISTDGYLTNPYQVDILVVHIGERYDFILETNEDYEFQGGNVFPIRIETVAVHCVNRLKPSKVSYAFLQYSDDEGTAPKLVKGYHNKKPCGNNKCEILNCPFKKYSDDSDNICHSVEQLQLLNPTPENRLPTGEPDVELFFNFGFRGPNATVNNVSDALPTNVPFTRPPGSGKVENECEYETAQCVEKCAHAVDLKKKKNPDGSFKVQKVRFVLSSINKKSYENEHTANIVTHPIHLHGHSFFVTKIGYPDYSDKGVIVKQNQDLTIPECGPGHWTDTVSISLNATTVRKDVIIVPAGGYVVIEFLADNPGWWFMHCHIDFHLNNGMGISVNELPECQSGPHNDAFNVEDSYWDSKANFNLYALFGNKCHIKRRYRFRRPAALKGRTFADETEKQAHEHEMEKKSDEINIHNLRQKTFNPVVNKNRDDQLASPYYKRLLQQRFRASAPDTELRKHEQAPQWDGRNEQIEESIQRGRNDEYM